MRANRKRQTIANHIIRKAFRVNDFRGHSTKDPAFEGITKDNDCSNVALYGTWKFIDCFMSDLRSLAM